MNVDSKIYAKYSQICKERGLIMSKQIENFMRRFLDESK